ncbi:MAG: CBS domain-containing protein [Rhizobiaceae bacterium]|nr:CBS domain-containing protein [Rhizobiaceae bacterium]
MLVQTIMTSSPITVSTSALVADAAKLMLDHHISGVPVVDANGALVGMVTESDFLRRGELDTERKRSWLMDLLGSPGKIADEYVRAYGRKVEEVMSWPVTAISPLASLSDAVKLMEKQNIKRLPVVENGKLVGIIARSDLLRAVYETLPTAPVSAADSEIEAAIVSELKKHIWSKNGFIRVNVANGIAELSGTIFDERERLAAKVVAENIPGVQSVVDQLVWIDPYYGVAMSPPETPVA